MPNNGRLGDWSLPVAGLHLGSWISIPSGFWTIMLHLQETLFFGPLPLGLMDLAGFVLWTQPNRTGWFSASLASPAWMGQRHTAFYCLQQESMLVVKRPQQACYYRWTTIGVKYILCLMSSYYKHSSTNGCGYF